MQHVYHVLGLMSGTSLDGLDMVYVKFWKNTFSWQYEIISAETISYPTELISKLSKSHTFSIEQICLLDYQLAALWSQTIIEKKYAVLDCIASHGHTILHAPEQGYTLQIGNPAYIAATTKIPVISDFRRGDIALGGKGAPLVPFGEKHLFDTRHYSVFLNLGGIANYSFHDTKNNYVMASDLIFVNMLINDITQQFFDKLYDHNGSIAQKGNIIPELLNTLKNWGFIHQNPPKSLGREQYEKEIKPILEEYYTFGVENILHTCYHFIAQTITENLKSYTSSDYKVFVTGGGAHNLFLKSLLHLYGEKVNVHFYFPETFIINYKEAIIFAFLGLMRWLNLPNTLPSVTGAEKSIPGGAIWLP